MKGLMERKLLLLLNLNSKWFAQRMNWAHKINSFALFFLLIDGRREEERIKTCNGSLKLKSTILDCISHSPKSFSHYPHWPFILKSNVHAQKNRLSMRKPVKQNKRETIKTMVSLDTTLSGFIINHLAPTNEVKNSKSLWWESKNCILLLLWSELKIKNQEDHI